MAEKYFSFEDALRELQVEEEELQSLVSDGKLRAFREGGGKIKFRQEDIARLKKDKKSEPSIILPSEEVEENPLGLGDQLLPATPGAALPPPAGLPALPGPAGAAAPPAPVGAGLPPLAPGAAGTEPGLPTIDFEDLGDETATGELIFEERGREEQAFSPIAPVMEGVDRDFVLEEFEDGAKPGETRLEDTEEIPDVMTETDKIDDQVTIFEETDQDVGLATDPLDVTKLQDQAERAAAAPVAPVRRIHKARPAPVAAPGPKAGHLTWEMRGKLRAVTQQRAGNPLFTLLLTGTLALILFAAYYVACCVTGGSSEFIRDTSLTIMNDWIRGRNIIDEQEYRLVMNQRDDGQVFRFDVEALSRVPESDPNIRLDGGPAERLHQRQVEIWERVQELWRLGEIPRPDDYTQVPVEIPIREQDHPPEPLRLVNNQSPRGEQPPPGQTP